MTVVLDTAGRTGEDAFDAYRNAVSRTFVPLLAEPSRAVDAFSCRLRSSEMGLLQVSEVEATAHVVRRDAGDDPGYLKLGVQLAGSAILRQDGRSTTLVAGDFALYDTARPYELEFHDEYTMLVLMFRRSLLRIPTAELRTRTARTLRSVDGAGALLSPLLDGVARECRDGAPAGGGHVCDAVLSLLAASLAAPAAYEPRSGDRLVTLRESAKAYIEQHLGESSLDVTRVAQAHHVSVRYLQKAFAEEAANVAGYIRLRRLERCSVDLADLAQPRSAAAIGARWGFVDAGHFSRVFRTHFGVPPGEYRARYRGPDLQSA
ncbi:helix-turn-helix domain-containing protein [Nocardioides sp. LS1]|uniref:AraC-like ligand-binding domain-containing protein n=1 Tax=Nocardioides sp. LS1 TaxID=1027620 RepID=UPI000F6280F1|nr:helix-turn-helix domain-containing protein [Nocardioides sp. LS1]GCD88652.1 AraC family transcriptional regulator [Nocardioides sp. LS1]